MNKVSKTMFQDLVHYNLKVPALKHSFLVGCTLIPGIQFQITLNVNVFAINIA